VLCSTAFLASITNSLSALINASVFLLSFAYLATCASAFFLEKKHHARSTYKSNRNKAVILFGCAFSVLLMTQVTQAQVLIASALFLIGVPVYVLFAPKKEIAKLKGYYLSRDAILSRAYHQGEVYLANVFTFVKRRAYRSRHVKPVWRVKEE
jgi:amino acid transporter